MMFNPNVDTHRYVKNNMMLIHESDDEGMGDALWRTSVAYIAYKHPMLKKGILDCFRKFTMINKKDYYYQASRCFDRYREDDVSRDQVILALSALKMNGDMEELKEIVEHLPKRISRRFKGSITMSMWKKAIIGKGKFYTYMFQLLELLEFSISVFFFGKNIRWLMGWNKEYDQEWYCGYDENMGFWHYDQEKDDYIWIEKGNWINRGHKLATFHHRKMKKNWFYRFMDGIEYPGYALHLTSWMIATSDDTFLKRILQRLAVWMAEKDNLLIRLLMKRYVPLWQINEYQPVDGYRWSTRFDGRSQRYYLEGDDAIYNTIDKDLLYALK